MIIYDIRSVAELGLELTNGRAGGTTGWMEKLTHKG